MAKRPKKKAKSKRQRQEAVLEKIHLNAAGIDVGAAKHFVAVPADRDPKPVRSFGAFTSDLHALRDWLKECQIDTVVMESTGVYWIPLFQVLEQGGLEVKLVNARHARNVPGRKTDVLDCQWLQQLHTFGLLNGSFRPKDQICVLRSYLRQRDSMVKDCSALIQRMQKALTEMNIQLSRVLSDITGLTGLRILRAILKGERDTVKLAQMKHPGVKSDTQEIARALEGDYRQEHLFALQSALELYDAYQNQILECERRIQEHLGSFELKTPLEDQPIKSRSLEVRLHEQERRHLKAISGADLTQLPGLDLLAVQTIVAEIGLDMSPWPSEKHFCSWLGVSPNNRISGGKAPLQQTKKELQSRGNHPAGGGPSRHAKPNGRWRLYPANQIAARRAHSHQRRRSQIGTARIPHAQIRRVLRRSRPGLLRTSLQGTRCAQPSKTCRRSRLPSHPHYPCKRFSFLGGAPAPGDRMEDEPAPEVGGSTR